MNVYLIWCNLKDSRQDLEFVQAVREYLGYFQNAGWVERFRICRRKLGFGPEGLGEFQIQIETTSLGQLDRAFAEVAARTPPVLALHAAVYSRVSDFKSALYRDFPDEVVHDSG